MKRYFLISFILAFPFILMAKSYKIEEFGAQAGNGNVNTTALQKAIDKCSNEGGGTLELSNGVYLSGTIHLKSNVSIRISPNSVLKAVEDSAAFTKIQSGIISRMDVVPWKAFIHADSQKNISIFGGGTIDGSGEAACFKDGKDNSSERPYGLFFINCENVSLQKLRLRSSAFWMQRYLNCSNVRLQGLDIYNHANKNNDGIDIDSSEDVIISDCIIDSSDDAIVIKSEGEKTAKNIVVSNCILGTHASAIKLGTGSVGGYKNISISNIVIRRSHSKKMMHPLGVWEGLTGIDIITTDGGALRQVMVSNVTMEDVENPIHIRLGNRLSGNIARQGYGGDGDNQQGIETNNKSTAITEQFILEDVTLCNIMCNNVGPYPVIVAGFEGHPVKRVTLRNITVLCAKAGTEMDLNTVPNLKANGYPGRGMYWTNLPSYGLFTYYTKDLVVDNFQCIPAKGEVRPKEKHLFRE